MNARVLCALTLSALVTGCAPAARVFLLPQPDGSASGVIVTTRKDQRLLNQPYQVADIAPSGRIEAAATSFALLRLRHPQLMTRQLPVSERFTLEFERGGSTLTPDSQARLIDIVARAKTLVGGEIVVTGHTDRTGTLETNDALSLERAHAVRQLLIERGFNAERIEAVGRGEREPLVPTADEVPEPRNRRVELLVR